MYLVAVELSTGHLAYPLIAIMIDQSPDRRPPISEICEALAGRRIERNRRINIVNWKLLS
jgi:hypothetical protein